MESISETLKRLEALSNKLKRQHKQLSTPPKKKSKKDKFCDSLSLSKEKKHKQSHDDTSSPETSKSGTPTNTSPEKNENSDETPPETPKKNRRKWTDKKVQQLCTLWEDEPQLYDSKHADYRKTNVRAKTYQRIAAALNMEGMYL